MNLTTTIYTHALSLALVCGLFGFIAGYLFYSVQSRRNSRRLNEADLMNRLDLSLSAAQMGTWEVDLATTKSLRSNNHDAIFGYATPCAEWTQQIFLSHVISEDRDLVVENMKEGLKKDSFFLQCRIQRADNKQIAWIEIRGKTIFDSQGKPTHSMGIVMDITDHKRVDEELKLAVQDNALYRLALDESAIVVFTDAKGTITYVNELFCKISGYTQTELLGKNHRILNSGTHSKDFFNNLWQTISSRQVWRGEICNRSKTGEIYWVDTYIVPCVDKDNNVERYFAVRFDITKRKLAEEQLFHSTKMSSLGRMAAGVAHEINNPLTIVYGQAHQLKKMTQEIPNSAHLQEAAGQIERMSLRIMEIINGLRTFSREGSSDPFNFVSLKKIVEETLSFSQGKLVIEGVNLKVDLIPEDIEIHCRSVQISQVLLNFLNNARDSVEKLSQKEIIIRFISTDTQVGISVEDNGPGVPSNAIANLFEPFFTTKEANKGTGLGLSVSKGIIESHHGHIFHEAVHPNGARFVFLLPKVI